VAVGERVAAGQKICESGSVGFSPEPHLHFTAFRSQEPEAPTTRVRFAAAIDGGGGGSDGAGGGGSPDGAGGSGSGGGGGGLGNAAAVDIPCEHSEGETPTYIPVAGHYYNTEGEQPPPAAATIGH
jgi:hypothetical protein